MRVTRGDKGEGRFTGRLVVMVCWEDVESPVWFLLFSMQEERPTVEGGKREGGPGGRRRAAEVGHCHL